MIPTAPSGRVGWKDHQEPNHPNPVYRYRELAEVPNYVRTRNMGRWHIPRTARVMAEGLPEERTGYQMWCGQLTHRGPLREDVSFPFSRQANPPLLIDGEDRPDTLPVCATCYGRAVGYGVLDNVTPTDLTHTVHETRTA